MMNNKLIACIFIFMANLFGGNLLSMDMLGEYEIKKIMIMEEFNRKYDEIMNRSRDHRTKMDQASDAVEERDRQLLDLEKNYGVSSSHQSIVYSNTDFFGSTTAEVSEKKLDHLNYNN